MLAQGIVSGFGDSFNQSTDSGIAKAADYQSNVSNIKVLGESVTIDTNGNVFDENGKLIDGPLKEDWIDLGSWYLDFNRTLGDGTGGTYGFQIGPAGIFGYAGYGAVFGGSSSVTLNLGDPTPGLSAELTVSGGNGVLGGLVSYNNSFSGQSGSVGIGWGVGFAGGGVIKYTVPWLEF